MLWNRGAYGSVFVFSLEMTSWLSLKMPYFFFFLLLIGVYKGDTEKVTYYQDLLQPLLKHGDDGRFHMDSTLA